jgi:hypothetical protein
MSGYYSAEAPAPHLKAGKSKVTVRTNTSGYQVYVCVANDRVPMRAPQAWALWVALGNALVAEFGPAPEWATQQIAPTAEG